MAYIKNTWRTKEKITKQKLDHVEDGIFEASNRAEEVNEKNDNLDKKVDNTAADIKKKIADSESRLSESITDIYNNIGYKAEFTNRYYIETGNVNIGDTVNFTPVSSSGYSYAILDCKEGDIFVLNGLGGGVPRLWAFTDSENKLVSVSSSGLSGESLELTVPPLASKLIINSQTNMLGNCYSMISVYSDVKKVEFDLSKRINDLDGKVTDFIDSFDNLYAENGTKWGD